MLGFFSSVSVIQRFHLPFFPSFWIWLLPTFLCLLKWYLIPSPFFLSQIAHAVFSPCLSPCLVQSLAFAISYASFCRSYPTPWLYASLLPFPNLALNWDVGYALFLLGFSILASSFSASVLLHNEFPCTYFQVEVIARALALHSAIITDLLPSGSDFMTTY